jgi:glucokinase
VADSVILAGDVGATKTILGLFSSDNGRPALISRRTFQSYAYDGLAAMVREFVPHGNRVAAACFGVAGAVIGDAADVTNLSWLVKAQTLARELQLERVSLINDLVATGYGISSLKAEELLMLNEGRKVEAANAAVIAAGTGLGECILHWNGQHYTPIATEAGHSDFAPHDETTLELTRYLRRRGLIVSVEQVVSGPGLLNIYSFLRDAGGVQETPEIGEKIRAGDAAVITQAALAGTCQLCGRTLDIFISTYGAEAGNLALRGLALGGIYLAGGIAPKIAHRLKEGLFMKAFVNKDRQSAMLSQIPVRVILNENTPLFGAVRYLLEQKSA